MLRVPAMVSDLGSGKAYLAKVRLELTAGINPSEATLIRCPPRALGEALVERVPASPVRPHDGPGMDGDLAVAGRGIGKTCCRAGAHPIRWVCQCRQKVCTCRGDSVRAWRS